jgi:hypothetical protein
MVSFVSFKNNLPPRFRAVSLPSQPEPGQPSLCLPFKQLVRFSPSVWPRPRVVANRRQECVDYGGAEA